MSEATRASPSEVSAVSDEEKKAEAKSPAATATHCQIGTKVGSLYRAPGGDACELLWRYFFQSYLTSSVPAKK